MSCKNVYSTVKALKGHLLLDCGKPKTYVCEMCPYSSKRKYNLQMHQKKKHEFIIDQKVLLKSITDIV